MMNVDYDVCVIGGGINGAGVARDAAGRGLSVLLIETKDLAAGTSSASSKLIHGGLRYLELFQFKLVRESLKERETLLAMAPHIIRPLDFIMPLAAGKTRPFWMIRLGLFLYDRLARRKRLHSSHPVDLRTREIGAPLLGFYKKGFCYADCWVDDARLVILNAMDAAARGAKIMTHTKCTKIRPFSDYWALEIQNEYTGQKQTIKAAMVVNAAGPWVREVLEDSGLAGAEKRVPDVRLVKGSHIIIPRAYEGDHAYTLQQDDKRIVFVLPYEKNYTLIGTTEEFFEPTEDGLYDPVISDEEIRYLCKAFSSHFQTEISRADVLWSYSGLRPLFEEPQKKKRKKNTKPRTMSRDFVLHAHTESKAPMISIFGGKLTTYRIVAEQTVNTLLHLHNRYSPPWTGFSSLPGGSMPDGNFEAFLEEKQKEYNWIPPEILERYARAYGTRMDRFLEGARCMMDLGHDFGAGLTEAEIAYLIRYEFAREAEDILWRRSKIGIHMQEADIEKFENALPALVKKIVET